MSFRFDFEHSSMVQETFNVKKLDSSIVNDYGTLNTKQHSK